MAYKTLSDVHNSLNTLRQIIIQIIHIKHLEIFSRSEKTPERVRMCWKHTIRYLRSSELLLCRHSKQVIERLEKAGLGYHVSAEKTCDKLGKLFMANVSCLCFKVLQMDEYLNHDCMPA